MSISELSIIQLHFYLEIFNFFEVVGVFVKSEGTSSEDICLLYNLNLFEPILLEFFGFFRLD